jgi:hypothetical protein
MIWNCSGNVLSYESNGQTYYLYAQKGIRPTSVPTLTISTTNSTAVSFSGGKMKLSSYYLHYSKNTISLDKKASAATVFAETRD